MLGFQVLIFYNIHLLQDASLGVRVLPAPGRAHHFPGDHHYHYHYHDHHDLPGVLPPEELQEGRTTPA